MFQNQRSKFCNLFHCSLEFICSNMFLESPCACIRYAHFFV